MHLKPCSYLTRSTSQFEMVCHIRTSYGNYISRYPATCGRGLCDENRWICPRKGGKMDGGRGFREGVEGGGRGRGQGGMGKGTLGFGATRVCGSQFEFPHYIVVES